MPANHPTPHDPLREPRGQEYYIENQVILSGPESELTTLLAALPEVDPQPVRVLRFQELGAAVTALPGLGPDWVIALYRLAGDAPDVRKAIRQLGQALTGSKKGLLAEPNYLAGSPWDPEGAPWEPEGSPWDPEGAPWNTEGSPAHPKQAARFADPDCFMDQWALRAIDPGRPTRTQTGAGVRVAVFDTSPYYPALPEGQSGLRVSRLAQQPPELALHVRHPLVRANPKPSAQPQADVRNHGYYVSGLVHALAPGCELHLVRVLGHDDCGDLFTLEEALFDFLTGLVQNPPAKGAVANFSLGVRVPPPAARQDLPSQVASLYALTRAARALGVVLVAAAGNTTKGKAQPDTPEVPGCFDTVLAVAACNQQNQRACFSNGGDLAAPGGDGRLPGGDQSCRPRGENGEVALVGPLLSPDLSETRYAYWSGTSFAAPLVSGLAALALEQAGPCPPEQIEQALRAAALPTGDGNLGAGLVQVEATLQHLLP